MKRRTTSVLGVAALSIALVAGTAATPAMAATGSPPPRCVAKDQSRDKFFYIETWTYLGGWYSAGQGGYRYKYTYVNTFTPGVTTAYVSC